MTVEWRRTTQDDTVSFQERRLKVLHGVHLWSRPNGTLYLEYSPPTGELRFFLSQDFTTPKDAFDALKSITPESLPA